MGRLLEWNLQPYLFSHFLFSYISSHFPPYISIFFLIWSIYLVPLGRFPVYFMCDNFLESILNHSLKVLGIGWSYIRLETAVIMGYWTSFEFHISAMQFTCSTSRKRPSVIFNYIFHIITWNWYVGTHFPRNKNGICLRPHGRRTLHYFQLVFNLS